MFDLYSDEDSYRSSFANLSTTSFPSFGSPIENEECSLFQQLFSGGAIASDTLSEQPRQPLVSLDDPLTSKLIVLRRELTVPAVSTGSDALTGQPQTGLDSARADSLQNKVLQPRNIQVKMPKL
jgi:hypothetical protein